LHILRERAVLHGDFVLSSGQHSKVYLDARLVTLSARGSGLVGRVLLDALQGYEVDAVAGLAIGADPIVTAVAVLAGQDGRTIDALIVRKERKEHGAGRQIEGPWRDGMRVAVLEDTVTTGAALLQAAQAVQAAGGIVVGAWALIDREQGGRENLTAAGHQFHAVFTAAELLA
jgi:orotate phosphoribosyltransferase